MPATLAYFDTSVLLKRYIQEAGSADTRALLRRHRVLTSSMAPVEAVSALVRRHRDRQLGAVDFADILRQVARDRLRWAMLEVTADVLTRAESIIVLTTVRTLDAIHLASCLAAEAAIGAPRRLRFITADAQQRVAGGLLGLDVEWVG